MWLFRGQIEHTTNAMSVAVLGLSRNVQPGHLREIFSELGCPAASITMKTGAAVVELTVSTPLA